MATPRLEISFESLWAPPRSLNGHDLLGLAVLRLVDLTQAQHSHDPRASHGPVGARTHLRNGSETAPKRAVLGSKRPIFDRFSADFPCFCPTLSSLWYFSAEGDAPLAKGVQGVQGVLGGAGVGGAGLTHRNRAKTPRLTTETGRFRSFLRENHGISRGQRHGAEL